MDKLKIVRHNVSLFQGKWSIHYGNKKVYIYYTRHGLWFVYHRRTYSVDGFLSAQLKAMELLNVRTKD